MPHIKLEYTDNIKQTVDTLAFFKCCHQLIVETIGAKEENCQSCAVVHHHFCVGSGQLQEGFIILDIAFLEGRTDDQKKALAQKISTLLQQTFKESIKQLKLQVRLKFTILLRSDYFKLE